MTHTRFAAALACYFAIVAAACGGRPVLLEGARARSLAASLHVDFGKAVEAADRAVMADTDAASDAAAKAAQTATQAADKDANELKGVLDELGYVDEAKELQLFTTRFNELKQLDGQILPLAVENSNLKAQRLSFGETQRAVDDLTTAVNAAAARAPKTTDAALAASRCVMAALRIQTLQARHIAEATDDTMSDLEQQMARETASAREQLARLTSIVGSSDQDIVAARVALDLFLDDNRSIVRMSRQNTNVRSLALSLGRKQVVAAECEAHLAAIDTALTVRESKSVR